MSYIYYKYLQEIGCVSQDHVDGFFQSGVSLIFVKIYTIKVYMTWKIIAAYLIGFSKYRRMAFSFLE